MENGYTVGELAHLVVPGTNAAEVAHVNRQLRHWTLTGVLKTLGVTHTGAGRHRKYSGDAVHVAALMVELSCLGAGRHIEFACDGAHGGPPAR